jgi:ribose 5-phosphate isomerase B
MAEHGGRCHYILQFRAEEIGGGLRPALASGGGSHYGAAMRIAIASDHAAVDLKTALREWLIDGGHEVADLGPDSHDSVDYPDFGYRLAAVIADGTAERGIALCGSGIGISIAANRNPAVRCALVSEPLSAALAREHNDANVVALGARLLGIDMAKACVSAFLSTDFAGGRHVRRVGKLSAPPFKEPA